MQTAKLGHICKCICTKQVWTNKEDNRRRSHKWVRVALLWFGVNQLRHYGWIVLLWFMVYGRGLGLLVVVVVVYNGRGWPKFYLNSWEIKLRHGQMPSWERFRIQSSWSFQWNDPLQTKRKRHAKVSPLRSVCTWKEEKPKEKSVQLHVNKPNELPVIFQSKT